MPAYGERLSEVEVNDLVRYIRERERESRR
jgi:hypothetical protein